MPWGSSGSVLSSLPPQSLGRQLGPLLPQRHGRPGPSAGLDQLNRQDLPEAKASPLRWLPGSTMSMRRFALEPGTSRLHGTGLPLDVALRHLRALGIVVPVIDSASWDEST